MDRETPTDCPSVGTPWEWGLHPSFGDDGASGDKFNVGRTADFETVENVAPADRPNHPHGLAIRCSVSVSPLIYGVCGKWR